MQKVVKVTLPIVLVAFALSCKPRETTDDFFQADYDTWIDNARMLSTERVYNLYKEQLKMKPPNDPTLSVVLGERGQESVDLMIKDLNNGDETIVKGYYNLLSEVRQRSSFDFCNYDDYYFKINRGLERVLQLPFPRSKKYEGGRSTAFDRMCGRMATSPD